MDEESYDNDGMLESVSRYLRNGAALATGVVTIGLAGCGGDQVYEGTIDGKEVTYEEDSPMFWGGDENVMEVKDGDVTYVFKDQQDESDFYDKEEDAAASSSASSDMLEVVEVTRNGKTERFERGSGEIIDANTIRGQMFKKADNMYNELREEIRERREDDVDDLF